MRELRLLEGISVLERASQRRERTEPVRLIDSILRHLRFILNTRQGGAQIARDYGISDFLDFLQNYPDCVQEIESSLRSVIERYEPRLEQVRVAFLRQEDDLVSLRFQIQAQVRNDGGNPVRFETVVETDGSISVQP